MYIVWTNYGSEGWSKREVVTWEEAAAAYLQEQQNGSGVILTEKIPVVIQDGREQ